MLKGEIAGTIGGDDKYHSPTKTQNLKETIVEVPGLELQGSSLPGDKPSTGYIQIPSDSEGECCCHREKCALSMEVELYRPFCQNVGSRVVPTYTSTEEIIGDYVENDVPGLSQIIILNQKDCLLFKGRRSKGEGYTWEEAMRFGNQISGAATWVGKEVMIRAVPVTLAKAKVDIAKVQQFIRTQNLEKMAVCSFKESRKEKEAAGQWESPTVPETPEVPRCKKPISRVDHYSVMKYGELATSACELEGCLSPVERVQLRCQQTRGTRRVQEVDAVSTDGFSDDSPPDDSSDELDSDDIVAYDTETSHYTTLADRTRREKRDFRQAHKQDRRTW